MAIAFCGVMLTQNTPAPLRTVLAVQLTDALSLDGTFAERELREAAVDLDLGREAHTDALVEALRRGDEDAFEALVHRESTRMLATARRLLGSEQDAQDAVQDAFLQVHRHVGEFQGESRVSTWLHRIVVNAALIKLRSRRRKPEQELDDRSPQFDEAASSLRPTAEWERPSEELLESAETRAMVRRSIDRLPASYREVLTLRDIDELDTEETAELLRVSTNAVKVRLHRARQALRGLLEQELTT
jgi:RNA polymerase sigma-70 factor (ECF subfamily)